MADEKFVNLWIDVLKALAQGQGCSLRQAADILSDQIQRRANQVGGEFVDYQPSVVCAFCGNPLEGSLFNALSKVSDLHGNPIASLCSSCLESFSALYVGVKNYYLFSVNTPEYDFRKIRQVIDSALENEGVLPEDAKRLATLMQRLYQRAAGILSPALLPVERSLRVAICGKNRFSFLNPIIAACSTIGLPFLAASVNQMPSAQRIMLRTRCAGDPKFLQSGVIVVLDDDGKCLPSVECSLISFTESRPPDKQIEIIDADDSNFAGRPRLPRH